MHRLIVVGGGAGGLELATRLGDKFGAKRARQRLIVTLVDRNPTHIWKPLLHEVAAGSMDPHAHQLEYAAQAHWHGFQFTQGKLTSVDRRRRTISIESVRDLDGFERFPARTLQYDTLVLSIGSETHYFGVTGAEEHTLALDTVQQAERFRRRLMTAALRSRSGRHMAEDSAVVNIAIVGAGATGVELAAELRSAADVLATYGMNRMRSRKNVGITLIDSASRILPALSERVSNAASHILAQRSIKIMAGESVVEVTPTILHTGSGKQIPTDITVWAAGIRAPAVLSTIEALSVNAAGQLLVRPTLQAEGDDNIFVFGDCAACPIDSAGRMVPPRAQAAHQQANFLVKAISRRLKGRSIPVFYYRDLGSLVSLGHESAVGSLMGGLVSRNLFIHGLLARVMYKSLYRMHIASLHGWRRMLLNTLAHRFRHATAPHVKLH